MTEHARTSRRTQAVRSATTRAALGDAAIDVLQERGWAAVTAAEVCERAGVSRGAFHHHYDGLPSLLADALRHLYGEISGRLRREPTDLTELIDATWRVVGNHRFKAVLEAWLATANDPSLRDEMGPVIAEFAELVSSESLAPNVLADDGSREYHLLARETLLGLALGRATNRGRPLPHEAAVLRRLRAGAEAVTAAGRR